MSQVFEPRFLGVVQVPIRDLRFVTGVGERLYKQQQTDRLRKLFKETSINHDSRLNWIDGYIDSTTVESLLSQLRLSQPELSQANAQCIYPCIRDQIVYCTQGRHRIAALDAESCVWTVRLSYINLGNLRESRIIKQRTEQYQHEEQDSDGRIYSKLREHTNSHVRFFDWYARLSREKQRIFRAVKRRYALVESLDQLIDIPGVIDFLHFGSLKDVFHHRVDAELLDGLRSIYTQWSYFTLGDPALRGSVNRDTVTTLDGRAPAASRPDREWIHNAFKNPKVFPGVTGAQRDEIERRIQSNPGTILSIRSLQDDLRYINIAAEIMWRHVLPKEARQKAGLERLSLREVLRGCWVDSPPHVEIQEGVFQPVLGPPSFELAYIQLMLAALRQFPYLSSSEPRVPKGPRAGQQRMPTDQDYRCVALLQRRAYLLGFRGPVVEQAIDGPILPFEGRSLVPASDMEGFSEANYLRQPNHRWGTPVAKAFSIIQESAFLPAIATVSQRPRLSVLYILKQLLRVFLDFTQLDPYHPTGPVISLHSESLLGARSSRTASWIHGQQVGRFTPDVQYVMPGAIAEESICSIVDNPVTGRTGPAIESMSRCSEGGHFRDDASTAGVSEFHSGNVVQPSQPFPPGLRDHREMDRLSSTLSFDDCVTSGRSSHPPSRKSESSHSFRRRRSRKATVRKVRSSAKGTWPLHIPDVGGPECVFPAVTGTEGGTTSNLARICQGSWTQTLTEEDQGLSTPPDGRPVSGCKSLSKLGHAENGSAMEESSVYPQSSRATSNGTVTSEATSSPEFRLLDSQLSLPMHDLYLSSAASFDPDTAAQATQPCSPLRTSPNISPKTSRCASRFTPTAAGSIPQRTSREARDERLRRLARARAGNRSTLVASPVRVRSEVPCTRPQSANSPVSTHSWARQQADARQKVGELSLEKPSQLTPQLALAISPVQPRSEVSPRDGRVGRSGLYRRPDASPSFNGHSPGALASLQARDPDPLKSASGCSWAATSISLRSEISTTGLSSASPQFTKRFRAHQRYDALQESRLTSPGTWSASFGASGSWRCHARPDSRSTPKSPSPPLEQRSSDHATTEGMLAGQYPGGLPRTELYGQLSGTQGFEDSEEDLVSIDLDD